MYKQVLAQATTRDNVERTQSPAHWKGTTNDVAARGEYLR